MALPSGIDTAAKITADVAKKAKAAGQQFVGRYLVPTNYSKALTADEAAVIHGAGLGILLCWETTASRAKAGAAAGAADGKTARELAAAVRVPPGVCVYFAADYKAQPSDYAAIEAYLRAAAEAAKPYEAGLYGHYALCEEMYLRGAVKDLWQCCAWSGSLISRHAYLYQRQGSDGPESKAMAARIGVAVDMDTCGSLELARLWMPGQYLAEDKAPERPMTDREIYEAVQRYAETLPLPQWAADELAEAEALGITDGTRSMQLIPRYQAAILAKRAVAAALREAQPTDDKSVSGLLTED